MNLLPETHSDFSSEKYWDEFFTKRGKKSFEWYGEYPELCGLLHKYVKPGDKILIPGCGSSQLSADMYDVGYHDITNIDISDVVIRQMREKNEGTRPNMKWLRLDMCETGFADGEFNSIIDKGTLDAILTDTSTDVDDHVTRMFVEMTRVLRLGGRYVCVSLLQDHIIRKILAYFTEKGWPVRIHRVDADEESKEGDKEFHMPVFVVVLTKFKQLPNSKPILEVCHFEDKMERYEDIDRVVSVVKEMQYYAYIVRQQLSKRQMADEVRLNLYTASSNDPRYTLHIVDKSQKSHNKFAIFIVPQGREPEWLFSTPPGRCQLTSSAGYDRLVIVTLHRNHDYENMEGIKAELSSKVMELAPHNLPRNTQVPFLSIGDDIGTRVVRHTAHTDLTGECVVEDVTMHSGKVFRRLIFLNSRNVIQSEVQLRKEITKKKNKKKTPRVVVNKSCLSCQHHVTMVAGLAFLQDVAKI